MVEFKFRSVVYASLKILPSITNFPQWMNGYMSFGLILVVMNYHANTDHVGGWPWCLRCNLLHKLLLSLSSDQEKWTPAKRLSRSLVSGSYRQIQVKV
ncbi:uncharacterized protein [Coffea arabica]|uniref:Uncharacterized protein isoform X3 n=1 Tax=Coffea arabica TaxID=13443 RepID=A0ABM4WXX3_COFAR